MRTSNLAQQPGSQRDDLTSMLEHADWIRRFAARLVQDGNEAEDVVQETLVQARALTAPAGVAPRAWLSGIVRNVARSRRRSERRIQEREGRAARSEGSVPSALEDAALMERQRELLRHIQSLPEVQRRAIVARFYDGLPPRKIAAAEGVSVSTIHSRIQRGVEALRSQLDAKYGDRRTWAAWCAPMIKVGAKAPISAGLLAAAGFIALLGGGIALRAPYRSADPTPALADLAQGGQLAEAPAPQTQDRPMLQAPGVDGPQDSGLRTAPSVPAGGVKVTVLSEESGQPVPFADVWAAPTSLFEGDQRKAFAIEQSLWNEGTRLRADEQGEVRIRLAPPLLVLASDETESGIARILAGSKEGTVKLAQARRLTVRVIDGAGDPVLEGFQVAAASVLKGGRVEGGGTDDSVNREVRKLVDGLAYFQNPWVGVAIDGVPVGPEDSMKASITAISIHAPGFAEFEPVAISTKRFRPFSRSAKDTERTLVLPESGSLRVELRDRSGALAPYDGRASVSFPGTTVATDWPESYWTPIEQGVAVWPAFVTGERPIRVTLSLPDRGARWTVQGSGPDRAGETKTLRADLPSRPVIRARLLDQDGRPLQLDNIALNHGHPNGKGRYIGGSVRASSAADGSVRFELPEDRQLAPPYALALYRSSWFKVQEAIAAIELSPADIQLGRDLGDLRLTFRKQVTIRGRVTLASGEPVSGVSVALYRRGMGTNETRTDAKGRYAFTKMVPGGSSIGVETQDLGLVPQTRSVSAKDAGEPQDFVLSTGATFRAQIDMGELGAPDSVVDLILRGADPDKIAFIPHLGSGLFQASGLEPGVYTSQLRLQGGQVIAGGPGLEVPASGEVSDPRIQGLRLSDHLRAVQVTWEGLQHERATPQMIVRPVPAEEGRFILLTRQDEPFLLPKRIPASATFTTPGRATIRIGDISTIGDSLHLVFEKPFAATLRVRGVPDPALDYSLVGEPGTSAAGSNIRITASALASGTVKVQAPAPGAYRLHRSEKPIPGGNGLIMVAEPTPTVEIVELEQPEDPGKPCTVELVIDAAPRQ